MVTILARLTTKGKSCTLTVYPAALQCVLSQEEQQRMQEYVGTPERLSALRDACLVRDRHRCVVSRAFDKDEALKRIDASVKAGGQDPPVG